MARLVRGRRRIGIRWWLGLAFGAVGLITAASVYLIVTRASERVIERQSGEIAVGRTVRIADRLGSAPPAGTRRLLGRYQAKQVYAAWAFDRTGKRLTPRTPVGAHLEEVPGREEAIAEALTGGRYLGEQLPGNRSVVAVPIFRGGVVDGALLAESARPLALQRSIAGIRRDSLIALGIAILTGIVVSFWVADSFARRIRRLARSAEHIAAGRFDIPLPTASADELGDLGEALEEMRERLRESFSELASERDRLNAILAGLSDAVLVIGQSGEARFANPAAGPLTHDGEPLQELLPLVEEAVTEKRAGRDIIAIGDHLYGVQARHLPTERAVLLVLRDRTEELRRELAEAEFVSNAAHELRNPIAGIASSIEVLQAGAKDDPEARDRFLQRLATDADRLTRITQSLLTLARVEATHAERSDEVAIASVVEEALDALPAPEGIEVACDIDERLRASGDRVLLRQVLTGLLSNAYKHTPAPGKVAINAASEGEHRVRVDVSDTGEGIPAEELGRVFERFYRGTGALEQEGFGLGLPIAKRMVDVMGGEIGVSSEVGRGSTFWVRLPAAHAMERAIS
jgi:two-component system, OmpR family, phosphate regulon sensor histidine kinase PhoR